MRKILGIAILGGLVLTSCGSRNTNVQANVPQSAATFGAAAEQVSLQPLTPNSNSGLDAQIVNGVEVTPHSLPYQALVMNMTEDGKGFSLCGGSIISDQWILTAAHCIDDATKKRLKVRVGVHDRRADPREGQTLDVTRFVVHPSWNSRPSKGYDIALIKVKGRITDPNASTINIPSASVDRTLTADGRSAVVSGWGRTSGGGKTSAVLRKVSVPVSVTSDCGRRLGLPQNTVCGLPKQEKDSCNGDSGGPLASSYAGAKYVIGIVSFGPRACSGNGIYTRVSGYADWIKRVSGVGSGGTVTPDPDPVVPDPDPVTPDPVIDPDNRAPSVDFGGRAYGQRVYVWDLSRDSDGYIAKREWDFGDGTTTTGQRANHTYSRAGTYVITLTVTDDDGATATVSYPVRVGGSRY